MRLVLQTLLEELNRLKNAGHTSLPVSESSLQALRDAVTATSLKAGAPTPAPSTTGSKELPKDLRNPPAVAATADTAVAKLPPAAGGESGAMEAFLSGKTTTQVKPPQPPSTTRKLPPPPELILPQAEKAAQMSWLVDQLRRDPVWRLQERPDRQPVFDQTRLAPTVLFIADHPAEEEEVSGEPFTSPAGVLFCKIIQAMGLSRDQVHIGYAVPWRPVGALDPLTGKPGAREANAEEIQYAQTYLAALVSLLKPPLLVALGATAAKSMLGCHSFKALSEVRGQWKTYAGLPLMTTFHPNYLKLKEQESKLAEKKAKRTAWEDMLKVMEKSGLPISEKQRAFFS